MFRIEVYDTEEKMELTVVANSPPPTSEDCWPDFADTVGVTEQMVKAVDTFLASANKVVLTSSQLGSIHHRWIVMWCKEIKNLDSEIKVGAQDLTVEVDGVEWCPYQEHKI